MKKLIALFGLLLIVTSCNVDDDGPQYHTSYAKVVNIDVPEYFVVGQTDTLKITYQLPTACHTALGVQSNRGQGEEKDDIFLIGVVSVDATLTQCSIDAPEEDLLEVTEATLVVEDRESYTFHLFQGFDDIDNEPIYQTIERPVYDEDSIPEPEEDTDPEPQPEE